MCGPRSDCLLVSKNRFEKFARIFSRRHKQTTFSDAVFLGALRVKTICMTCLSLFSGKNKKAIVSLSSAELVQRIVKVNLQVHILGIQTQNQRKKYTPAARV